MPTLYSNYMNLVKDASYSNTQKEEEEEEETNFTFKQRETDG
jgi:hypothetical protein